MESLYEIAAKIAKKITEKGQTVSVIESSSGGLISSALLSQPGASKYYIGGQVIYTAASIRALTGLLLRELKEKNIRSSSEPFALLLGEKGCELYKSDWCITETGAAGPSGNGYGDPSGFSCYAISGLISLSSHINTDSKDRVENMIKFAEAALNLLLENLE